MNGAEMIAVERRRQVEAEGWTTEHDDTHEGGELALAAACYASPKPLLVHEKRVVQLNSSRGISDAYQYDHAERLGYYDAWPWEAEWDKRNQHGRLRQLTIAGALIAAEIDRLMRLSGPSTGETADV